MHRAPVYDRLTRSTEVCIEQPFMSCSQLLSMHGAAIFFCRAASIEEGSDPPFTH